jgi:TPR repeat protein
MYALGGIHDTRKEYVQAFVWFTKGAEAGLPNAMFNLACCLDEGKGVAAADYPAAADWYRRAADAGVGEAAANLASMYTSGRGRAWQIIPASSFFLLI